MDKKYQYECRPCPPSTRSECIQQSRMSPGVKRMIERAFISHTDTQATWDLLHRNCLLELRDQAIAARSRRKQSGLLGRLQKQAAEKASREQEKESPPPCRQATHAIGTQLVLKSPSRSGHSSSRARISPSYQTSHASAPRLEAGLGRRTARSRRTGHLTAIEKSTTAARTTAASCTRLSRPADIRTR